MIDVNGPGEAREFFTKKLPEKMDYKLVNREVHPHSVICQGNVDEGLVFFVALIMEVIR